MILELEENANDCLHCGGRPTAGHNDYIGDTYIGDTYCFFCKCGISTEWFSAEELLQGGGDKLAQMMAMMSQFNSTVEAL